MADERQYKNDIRQHPAEESKRLEDHALQGETTKSSLPEGDGRIVSPDTDGGGALDDLLDDYRYTSQPNTPGLSPSELASQALASPERPDLNKNEDPEMYQVRNIRRIDANPPRT